MKLKAFLLFFLLSSFSLLQAADKPLIKIETERTSLIYQVADNGRLYQKYLGKKLNHDSDIQYLPQGTEAYLTHGMDMDTIGVSWGFRGRKELEENHASYVVDHPEDILKFI